MHTARLLTVVRVVSLGGTPPGHTHPCPIAFWDTPLSLPMTCFIVIACLLTVEGWCESGVHPLVTHIPTPLHAGIHTPCPIACLDTHIPMNRMTDRCKNITLPQTSFAGGNYVAIFVGPTIYADS